LPGKHEPPTGRSFYISMGTSTARILIIVALAASGVAVIANAFPDSAQTPLADGEISTREPKEPVETETTQPKQEDGQAAKPTKDLNFTVFNTTEVVGLAALTADEIEAEGYKLAQRVGNADSIDVTLVQYRDKEDRVDAEYIAKRFFKGATIEQIPADSDVLARVDIAIYLGNDYASEIEQ
jgi:hypothetical protein